MIHDKNYQLAVAVFGLDMAKRQPWQPLGFRPGSLLSMLEVLNQPSQYSGDNEYLTRRAELRERGNLLWQRLSAFSEAVRSGSREQQEQALQQAAQAMQGFDESMDGMAKGRFLGQLLQEGQARSHSVSSVLTNLQLMGVSGSDKEEREYLQSLNPAPYQPLPRNDPRLNQGAPDPGHQEKNPQDYIIGAFLHDLIVKNSAYGAPGSLNQTKIGKRAVMSMAFLDLVKQGEIKKPEDCTPEMVEKIKNHAVNDYLNKPAFRKLLKNDLEYLGHMTSSPRKMVDFYRRFRHLEKLQEQQKQGKLEQNYDNYIDLHMGPLVPKGKEREYMAKAAAARMLKAYGEPFDKKMIRKEAATLMESRDFKQVTADKKALRRLLMEGESAFFIFALEKQRNANVLNRMEAYEDRIAKGKGEAASWEGLLRDNMNRGPSNPPDRNADVQTLAKIVTAIDFLGRDVRSYSKSAMEKRVAHHLKDPAFLEFTKDHDKVREMLTEKNPMKISFDKGIVAETMELQHQKQQPAAPMVEGVQKGQPQRQGGGLGIG